jgi:predicted RND superfamily exporter protein
MRTPSAEDLGARAGRGIAARPKTVLALFLAAAAPLAWHAPRMRVDATADTLLTKDDEHYVRTLAVDRRFSPREFLLVAYRPRSGEVFSEETKAALGDIAARLGRLPRVDSVRSLLDAPLLARSPEPGLEPPFRTVRELDLGPSELRKAFTGHPIYEDLLLNKGRTAAALQVSFKPDPALERLYGRIVPLKERALDRALSEAERAALGPLEEEAGRLERRLDAVRDGEIRAVRAVLAGHERRAEVYLGGVHVLAFQLIRIIKNDLAVFGGAVAAVSCLLLALLFRRPRWVAAPALCTALTVLTTMGLFALLGLKTTVISSSFISLQLVLTLALVMHLIIEYRELAAEHPGWPQPRLVERTLARKAAPCFYVWLSASMGFVSLAVSGIQPVISFGWMMMIALAVSVAVSLALFPALMALVPREAPVPPARLTSALLARAAALARGRPGAVAAAFAVLHAAAGAGLPRLTVENSFIDYFRARTLVHRELSYLDREFGGTTPLDVVWTVPEAQRGPDLVLTAAAVRTAQRIQAALERREGVGKTLSIVDFTELARTANGGRPLTEYELTAAYRTLDPALREQLTGALFDEAAHQVRFSVRVRDTTPGLDRAALLEGVRSDLAAQGVPATDYRLTGLFVLYQDILERLFRSQILTLGVVWAQLGLVFLAVFRSARVALIALAPNAVTTVTVLGVMGWAGVPLDIMTITISSIAMGVATDDAIHYTHRYLEEARVHPPGEAVSRTHASAGQAMLCTTVVVLLAFSLLAFSDFMPSVYFGLLTGLAMAVALLADLTLLPALLARFAGSKTAGAS